MKKKPFKFEYDPEVDAAYLTLKKGRVTESEEVGPGIIIDFDASDEILGVEILRFTRRFRTPAGTIKAARAPDGESSKRRAAG